MVGIVPGASSCQASDPLGSVAESAMAPAVGAFACRAVLHFLALPIAETWAALFPLLLLFGSLRQDLATFLCKIIAFPTDYGPHRQIFRRVLGNGTPDKWRVGADP
jgi:hypothetical protein